MNSLNSGVANLLFLCIIIPYGIVSIARVGSSIHNYNAPLNLYNHLYKNEIGRNSKQEMNICLGKEWYRYGSSFFIPSSHQQIRFIKSGFDGLLPQVFPLLFYFMNSLSNQLQEHGRFLNI